ncbi:MAG: 50S ribosomal protein L32e [Thermoprotei archaeon]|nr:MAG: 50S ribosomal protein L32e [Thermoprotei archaeon]RLE82720.1 MAG: 50S ribosomal protein L32e [Thermoprotei archaeon]RLF03570.1 MAG: 50S ribosomal protein L32e [Thermoprotei archaeon]
MSNKVKPKLSREMKRMLEVRERIKRKTPFFTRMNAWFLKRLDEDVWRYPGGLDNKIRLERKGFPAKVKVGYRGPRLTRGLHPSGFEEVIVHNVNDLLKVNKNYQAIRIASTVGRRKRLEILKKAEEMGIKVLNPLSEEL